MSLLDAIADEARGLPFAIDPRALLRRDRPLSPPGLWSPNRHCRMVEAADGWIAVNLARAEDQQAVAAWLETAFDGDPWDAVIGGVRERCVAALLDQAILLGMPVSAVGEHAPVTVAPVTTPTTTPKAQSVIDLSALWAGPLCGALLAEAGMQVTKIEDPARPDPTASDARLNGAKARMQIDLASPALLDAITASDILITSARQHALARLGLTPAALFARNPALIWVAITAYGFTGSEAMRVGFGDDCAAAGGLVRWQNGSPHFIGDALADPLTGLRAARLVLEHVATGVGICGGLIDAALAPTAACYAKFA
jgi:hypothetical protein